MTWSKLQTMRCMKANIEKQAWQWLNVFMAAVLLTGMTGCGSTLASHDIRHSRQSLNDAVARTAEEQLLLALVQTRYLRSPGYLEVAQIITQITWSAGVSGSAATEGASTVGPSVSYSETPTITYDPITGSTFVSQQLDPVSLDTLLVILASGWDPALVLGVMTERFGSAQNGVSGTIGVARPAPSSEKFKELVDLLDRLNTASALWYSTLANNTWHTYSWEWSGGINDGGKLTQSEYASADSPIVINFNSTLIASSQAVKTDYEKFCTLLGLDPKKVASANTNATYTGDPAIILQNAQNPTTDQGIKIQTRSMQQILGYLAWAVDVPEERKDAGWVWTLKDEAGAEMDGSEMCNNLLDVRVSASYPTDAAIAVEYEGYWYFISHADLRSKTTMRLLLLLNQLMSGSDGDSSGPNTTLGL